MEKGKRKKGELFLGITWCDVIGLLICFGFRFIPAPAPLTSAGMAVIGALLGSAFIFSTVGTTWGVFATWLSLAGPAKELLGGSHGIWEVTAITMGDWLVVFVLLSILLCYALKTSGFMARFGYWFMTRKIVGKSPWTFLLAWMLLAYVLGMVVETATVGIFLYGVAYSIFERVGFEKGEKYPALMVIGTTIGCLTSQIATPIAHGNVYKSLALYSGVMGDASMPLIQSMLIMIPVSLLTLFLTFLIYRYLEKPDVTKMKQIDYVALMGNKPKPMDRREKWVVGIYMLIVLFWILPSFLDMLVPDWGFTTWLDEQTSVSVALVGLVAMCLIHIDGEPLLNFKEAFKSVPWGVVLVMSCARSLATMLSNAGTGFNDWVAQLVNSISLPAWGFVVVVCFIMAFATNFSSNTPITTLGISVLVPQAASMGIPAAALATMVCSSAGYAVTFPSGFALLGYLVADEWNIQKVQLRTGALSVIICFLLTISLGYGLGLVFFR